MLNSLTRFEITPGLAHWFPENLPCPINWSFTISIGGMNERCPPQRFSDRCRRLYTISTIISARSLSQHWFNKLDCLLTKRSRILAPGLAFSLANCLIRDVKSWQLNRMLPCAPLVRNCWVDILALQSINATGGEHLPTRPKPGWNYCRASIPLV